MSWDAPAQSPGKAGAEQAPWSRVSGVAGVARTVTCPRGTSKTPAAPRFLLPTATSRSPPAATAARAQERLRSAAFPGAEAPAAAGAPRGTGFSLFPPPPSERGWACREERASTRGALGAVLRSPVPGRFRGSGEGGVGKPKAARLEKWGFEGQNRQFLGMNGERGRDLEEFFGVGQILTRAEQARAESGERVSGIRAGTWEGGDGGGGLETTKRSPRRG